MSIGVSSIRYTPSQYNTSAKNLNNSSKRLSSGNRINSAADDAANLAISEKLTALIKGLDQGTNNSYDMQNLLKTAEGGLDTIGDSLQRIRELGVQASNGIYSDSDKAIMQEEVNQLVSHINMTASNTQFNNKNLLDGSFTNQLTASYADGSGMNVSISGMSAEALGIKDFNLTGHFSLDAIDNAIGSVSSQRSSIGSSINRLDYTINQTSRSSIEQATALSKIADTDYGKESITWNTNRVLQQYRNFSFKNQMAMAGNIINLLI